MLSEKAKSKAQQRFFGMVRAAQKGEMENPSSEVLDAADSMKVDDVKKFAKTKHKGLPEKKEVKEGSSVIYVGKKRQYHGPTGDHKRDKEGNIVSSHYKKKPSPTGEKYGDKSNRAKTPKPADVRKRTKKGETVRSALNRAKKYEHEKARAYSGDAKRKAAKTGEYAKGFNEASQVNEVIGQVAGGDSDGMMNWGMNNNPYLKSVAGALVPGGKQKAKKEVKQKSAEVTGNVADKISKPIGGTRVQESKGTAELAGLALRGKKRCAHCGSFTHVTGQCPKKEHGVVNKRTVTSEAKEEEGRSDYGKASVRNKRRFGTKGENPDPLTGKKITKGATRGELIDKRREEHQQRQAKSGVTEGVMDIVRKYTDKKKPEKKAEKAQDAGARAKRKLARKVHATYVSGSEDNVPDDIRDHKTWNDFKKHIN